jgi:hypothetical protein
MEASGAEKFNKASYDELIVSGNSDKNARFYRRQIGTQVLGLSKKQLLNLQAQFSEEAAIAKREVQALRDSGSKNGDPAKFLRDRAEGVKLRADVNVVRSQQVKKRADDARRWLESVSSSPRFSGKITVYELPPAARAYAQPNSSSVYLSPRDKIDTHVHEIGHVLETRAQERSAVGNYGVGAQFRDYRVQKVRQREGESTDAQKRAALTYLQDLFPSSSFDKSERSYLDEFDKAFSRREAWYVGKVYPDQSVSEVVSMGLENLYRDPTNLARRDPEYAKFLLGVLDGVFE